MGYCWKGAQRVHEEARIDKDESLRKRVRLFSSSADVTPKSAKAVDVYVKDATQGFSRSGRLWSPSAYLNTGPRTRMKPYD
jgi:hypothetical protein